MTSGIEITQHMIIGIVCALLAQFVIMILWKDVSLPFWSSFVIDLGVIGFIACLGVFSWYS